MTATSFLQPIGLFGPGSIYLTRTDIPNQTSVNVGFANEFSISLAGEDKSNYGQRQFALDAARGTIKATGKIKAAEFSAMALNTAFFGETPGIGGMLMSEREAATVPAAAPYTIVVANEANFDTDLGVVYASTGAPFVLTAAAPTQGQYSVSNGTYAFAAADEGAALLITYAYTTGSGTRISVTNQQIGSNPTFQLDYANTRSGITFYARVYKATSSKLDLNFKLTDWVAPEIDITILAPPSGQVFDTFISGPV